MALHSLALVVASLALVAALQPPATKASPTQCECINWKTTYELELARCGDGHEFYDLMPSKTPEMYRIDKPDAQLKVCGNFFKRLDSNFCVSMNPGTGDGTWCYVDKQCDVLRGGHKLANVSWKQCAQSDSLGHYRMTAVKRDTQLRDIKLPDLWEMSQKQDLWLGGLVKMAYPGARAGENKPANLEDFRTQIPVWADQHIAKGGFRATPYWFDTNGEGTLPIVVVTDGRAFEVHENKHQDAAHPKTWATYRCLVNCW